MYHVKKGTAGKLLTQHTDEDITSQDWVSSKDVYMDCAAVLVDPNGKTPLVDTMAFDLYTDGYYVFEYTRETNAKYMFAVKDENVRIG